MDWSTRQRNWKRVMKPNISDTINILGENYKVKKTLGKGKGGYSFLVEDTKGRNFTLKCFHHETVEYYTFSTNKVDLELNAYSFLIHSNVKIPRLLYWDREREIILKEFIPGETALERVERGEDLSSYFPTLSYLQREMKERSVNLDWYPSNFIEYNNALYYIDYEISPYDEKWSFENWGVHYWKKNK